MIDTKRKVVRAGGLAMALGFTLWCKFAIAEPETLRDAISQAAVTNPGVQATWHAFEAAGHGMRAAKGGFLPQLDLQAEKGRERTLDPQDIEEEYDIESYRITLTQMLFDGFATWQDVKEQSFLRLVRYYEFKEASEQMGLETAQAYLDVLRFRELVRLARANYEQHFLYHRDIKNRVQSGLGRGVDLEQAEARLALAESNVLTEITNLHDVSARYQRLVGEFPPNELHSPDFPSDLIPGNRSDALERAFLSSPQLNASIENIRATRADYKGRNAPMMPRLDLRLRKQRDDNTRGTLGEFDEEAVELVMSYNLYRGGSDSARKRQARSLMMEAKDTRDRICREVRQTVAIAHNDIDSRTRLIALLERNEAAISKAREAYKNQFDIGQRTLLDLLDTENEVFEVRRTLANARYELVLAEARTLAGMGLLLYSLNVDGLDKDIVDDLDLSREEGLGARCPAEAPEMMPMNLPTKPKATTARSGGLATAINRQQGAAMPVKQRETMRLNLKFENGSAALTPGNRGEIARVAAFMCDNPKMRGEIQGHTDSQGAETFNQRLSQSRADSVLNALVAECPQAAGRLTARGYGESRPVARNDTAEGRAANRRVELALERVDQVSLEIAPPSLELGRDKL